MKIIKSLFNIGKNYLITSYYYGKIIYYSIEEVIYERQLKELEKYIKEE